MSHRKMICSGWLVVCLVAGLVSPIYAKPNRTKVSSSPGSHLAGIKGYSTEIATLPTSHWTTIIADLQDGNLMMQAKPLEIMGTGKSVSFELFYNSVNSSIDTGLGMGWTSNVMEKVMEDPTTLNVTYENKTGAQFLFVWDANQNIYLSPKGFEGSLNKTISGSYIVSDWNFFSTHFDVTGKIQKIARDSLDLITIQYNVAGFPVSIADAISGRSITLTWNQGHITEAKDPMNHVWKLNYSTNYSLLLSLEKPDQDQSIFTYNTQNMLSSQADFKSQTYTVSYVPNGNHQGKLASIALPNSKVYEWEYDTNVGGFAKKTDLIDPEQFSTSYYFGATSGHLEKIARMDGSNEIKTTYGYDNDGFIISISDSFNQAVTYTRDSAHRLIEISYPPALPGGDPYQIQYVLDPATHLLLQKKEKINSTPIWASTSYEYTDQDCPTKPSKQTDPLGTETTYDYNTNQQVVTATTGTGSFAINETKTNTYTYSTNANISSFIDGEGNETTYVVNANGLIEVQIQFEGLAQSGVATLHIENEYDVNNQMVTKNNITANLDATKTLDENGATTSSTSFGGCTSSSNPGFSYLITQTAAASKGSPGNCLDPIETDLSSIKLVSLGALPGDRTIYQPKPLQMTDSSNHTTLYEYFGNGTIKKETDYLGRESFATLDLAGRIGKITDWKNKEVTFGYDINNRMTSKDEEGIGISLYTYYQNNKIKTAFDPIKGNLFYSYNLPGNLLSDEKGFYAYNLKGQVLSANYFSGTSDTWSYSREGYTLSKNNTLYTTNKMGNMTQINSEYGTATLGYTTSVNQLTQINGTGDMGSYSLSYNTNNQPIQVTDTIKNNNYHYAWNSNATLAELTYANQTRQTYTYLGKHPDALEVKKGANTLYSSDTDFDTNDLVSVFTNEWKENQITHQETTSATYDPLKRTSTLNYASDNQTIQYSYAAATSVLSSVSVSGSGSYSLAYTPTGKISTITYQGGAGVEMFSYNDSLGRVSGIQYPNNQSLSFTWNSKSQITQVFGLSSLGMFSYNMTYDQQGKMKNYTKSENGMQTESWSFAYGLFGLEKATRTQFGLQDLTMDFTTDFSGRVLSMTYQQISGYIGELYFHYDNYGNTSILTDANGDLKVGYLYKLHNGSVSDTYNPLSIVCPLLFNARSGYITIEAFGGNMKLQVNPMGSVDLSGGAIGVIDLRAVSGGPIVVGGNQPNLTVNDSISPCLEDCEKKGMVKCCKEYRSRGECEKNCNDPGSGNGMNEHDPVTVIEECIQKCTNNCKEWGCCNTGSSPSVQ